MVMDDVVSAPITLRKGRNVIRGAVINGPGLSDFCVRFIDLHYVFTPSLKRGSFPFDPIWLAGSLGAVLVVGGIWMLLFVMHVKKKPLLTESHPYLAGGHDHHTEEPAHVA